MALTKVNNGEDGIVVRGKINDAFDQIDANEAAIATKQDLDAELTALAGVSSNGVLVRTGAGTAAARTLTGTSGAIEITNGDGVSGNPTFNIGANVITSAALSGVLAGYQPINQPSQTTLDIDSSTISSAFAIDGSENQTVFTLTAAAPYNVTLNGGFTRYGSVVYLFHRPSSTQNITLVPGGGMTLSLPNGLSATMAPGSFACMLLYSATTWIRMW